MWVVEHPERPDCCWLGWIEFTGIALVLPYFSSSIHENCPDAHTFSVIFTENRAVVLLTLWVESGQKIPSMGSPDVWLCPKALMLKELQPTHWDWLPLPCLGFLCCDMLLLRTKPRHFKEAWCGNVQVTIHFSNSAASTTSDYTPVTHGKHLGMTASNVLTFSG